jgi:hypothetical protein
MIKITEYSEEVNSYIENEFNQAIKKQVAYLEQYFKINNFSRKVISERSNYILDLSSYDYHLRESMLISSTDEFLDVINISFSLYRNNLDGMGITMLDRITYNFLSPAKKRMEIIEKLELK